MGEEGELGDYEDPLRWERDKRIYSQLNRIESKLDDLAEDKNELEETVDEIESSVEYTESKVDLHRKTLYGTVGAIVTFLIAFFKSKFGI